MDFNSTRLLEIYDTKELLDSKVETKDLWKFSKLENTSQNTWCQLNAVTNSTKLAITGKKTLKVLDFWKDRDYEVEPELVNSSDDDSDDSLDVIDLEIPSDDDGHSNSDDYETFDEEDDDSEAEEVILML